MKKTILLFLLVFCFYNLNAQSNSKWKQINRTQAISVITADDIDSDIVHLGTNLGYIKYNTSTNQIVDQLNLTDQDPAIVNVRGIAVNPINNEVALSLDDGFAIYDGATNLNKYTYSDSDLTIGLGSSQTLDLNYGVSGLLYMSKSDVFGYQTFDSGTFNTEVSTTFRPQDIEESADGTKVYFAGWNDGLHELTKGTGTFINYNSSNSDLIYNPLEALHRDNSGNIYVGGFQGFNMISSTGVWSSFQQMIPSSLFFYPVYDFSTNNTDKVIVRCSGEISSSKVGFCEVDISNNTWTNFTNDNTNCLNENEFKDVCYASHTSSTILAASENGFNPNLLTSFDASSPTTSCSNIDLNYLDPSGLVVDPFYTNGFSTRSLTNGNLELAFTNGSNIVGLNFDPSDIDNSLSTATFLAPNMGDISSQLYDAIKLPYSDKIVTDNGMGINFTDLNNDSASHNFSLSNFFTLKIKMAPDIDDNPGDTHLLTKVNQNGQYKAYKTVCDIANESCQALEEILTTNRDFEEDFRMAIADYLGPGHNVVSIIKANSAGERSFAIVETNIMERIYYDQVMNQEIELISTDPVVGSFEEYVFGAYISTITILSVIAVDTFSLTFENSKTDVSFDLDYDSIDDKILRLQQWEDPFNSTNEFINIIFLLGTSALQASTLSATGLGMGNIETAIIPDLTFSNPPLDIAIYDSAIIPQNQNMATGILLTNYGFLINPSIDISGLSLGVNNNENKFENITLYPNPSSEYISFSDKSITEIEVYDLNGRLVHKASNNKARIEKLNKGVYLVKGIAESGYAVSKKLIKI